MSDGYVVYKCLRCSRHFVLMGNEIDYSEQESRYITCPYHGKHKNIIAVGKHEGIKECMQHDSFKRVNRRVRSNER